MVSQIYLNSEANPQIENIRINECGGTLSTQKRDEQQLASSGAKKPTRQWAAWTRQEEEMFFNALRQFGKNFEKITVRVLSKSKDQVRHYYYRLLRRMNKLLGPEVCLNAKNSKDTNAAMLRWWTLLEKYSCKSSKLHLKPRRFKIFLETLVNQLLKDRKKHKRKQPSQRENCSPTTPIVITAGRLVLVDSQNIQQSNSGKEVSLKRNVNVGTNRKNCMPESITALTAKQKKKPVTASKFAYKRWEKAAIAGVSLVADAAEHVERAAIYTDVDQVQGRVISDPAANDVPSCSTATNLFVDNNAQTFTKLKLQLFPIDEGTRKALEAETHNPHLELTLSTRKKISSVLEHLNRKWGSSCAAIGQLMVFPYYAQSDNLAGYLRWTQDSILSAAEVYVLIGSPSLFRLRYGWCSNAELASATIQAPLVSPGMISNVNVIANVSDDHNKNQMQTSTPTSDCRSSHLIDRQECDQHVLSEKPLEVTASDSKETNNIVSQSYVFSGRIETSNGAILREVFSEDDIRLGNGHSWSVREWADTLTNISIGDLLSDVPQNIGNNTDPLPQGRSHPSQGPFSCSSFDAAVTAHIYRHQSNEFWEAEETRDAFSFQKSVPCNQVPEIGGTSLADYGANNKESVEMEVTTDEEPVLEEPMYECAMDKKIDSDNAATNENPMGQGNTSGLLDMYWPDSLGPFDLDIPTSKYNNENLILSDSLSGFSRMFGNSLDAFQNCSIFASDKKETQSGVEGQNTLV